MIEYLPWSNSILNSCLNDYENGIFDILDIELGGHCNYHCIYCDSPCREKECTVSINKIEDLFKSRKIRWVFICGLGEPTVKNNLPILYNILDFCEQYGAKCSIFTNLSNLNNRLLKYIADGVLNILFKYDSKDIIKNRALYGVPNTGKQLANIDKIKKYVSISNNCTNIAASIVPTKTNKDDIIDIVSDCLSSGIYPLIAELENSGDAQEYYNQLSLSSEELQDIKSQVEKMTGEQYIVPVCPAVICGIHIRHDGIVTVDEYTGLSCHWFWLEEPRTKQICDFNTSNISSIEKDIEKYRDLKLESVFKLHKTQKETVFGGCGGDVTYLLDKYMKIKKRGE